MDTKGNSGRNKKYGFHVLISIIATFLAVIAAIYFTAKPLMTKEENGRVLGSINTFTNFYIDYTSDFRNKMLDTINLYSSLTLYQDSLSVLCNKMKSVSNSIKSVSIRDLDTGFTVTDDFSEKVHATINSDSLLIDCLSGHHFSTTLTEYDGVAYYISYYPFFNLSDEPCAVASIIIDMEFFADVFEAHNPYKEGLLYILYDMDRFASIGSNCISVGGNAMGWAEDSFGDEARNLLLTAFSKPNKEGFIIRGSKNYFYAKYDDLYYYMFFYAVDRKFVSDNLRASVYNLLFFCLLGGFVILFTCMKNMKLISQNARQEEQQRKDLETAASIQRSMLPPGGERYMSIDIGSKLIPAKGVGGDLFYHWIRDGRLYFCVGDISGKGIPASLYMSKTVSLFHIISSHDYTPSEMASKLNAELCLNNESGVFLTLFIGILDLKTHELCFCNAGHDEPIYWDGDRERRPIYLKTSFNCPIGFEENTEFKDGKIQLSHDYLLVFYTDGINEAKADNFDMFGLDRLLESVAASKELRSDDINERIIDDVASFVGKHEQSDDMTLLTLRHQSSSKSISIRNNRKQLRKIAPYLKDIFNEAGLGPEESAKLRRGIDEAMTNAVSYAYDGDGDISLGASIDNSTLTFTITDTGVEFNPLSYENTGISSDPDKIGGLGIAIIRQSFDELEYVRKGTANILKLIYNGSKNQN